MRSGTYLSQFLRVFLSTLVRSQSLMTSLNRLGGLVAFCVCPLDERIVIKSCFRASRSDEHAELLKSYFKLLAKKLKFSTLVVKSDFRFKVY